MSEENVENLRAVLEAWDPEAWKRGEVTIELEEILGTGDRLVSVHRVSAKTKHTGIEFSGPVACEWTFRDGKVIHFQSFRDRADALEAAGLRE